MVMGMMLWRGKMLLLLLVLLLLMMVRQVSIQMVMVIHGKQIFFSPIWLSFFLFSVLFFYKGNWRYKIKPKMQNRTLQSANQSGLRVKISWQRGEMKNSVVKQ